MKIDQFLLLGLKHIIWTCSNITYESIDVALMQFTLVTFYLIVVNIFKTFRLHHTRELKA